MFWQLHDLDDPDGVARSVELILDVDRAGTGAWFKQQLVGLITKTAQDFAPRCPAAFEATDDPHARGIRQSDGIVKWKQSNHQCILFQNASVHSDQRQEGQSGGGVTFLAVNYTRLRDDMDRHLIDIFEENQFVLAPTEHEVISAAPTIFSAITGVIRSPEEAASLVEGNYCMTNDNLLKMVAIFVRVRCGVPVVLMGECGCGKSELMRFVCDFLKVKLLTLNVHGGTTKADVYRIFAEASVFCKRANVYTAVYVFLDEVNTSTEIGLLSEAIVLRSLNGISLHPAIQVVGAVNPYRRRPQRAENAGLGLNQHGGMDNAPADELGDLVYRVHPLPASLLAYVFDFGHLEDDVESMYVTSMVKRQFESVSDATVDLLTAVMRCSQDFVRAWERESSAVSLRDVARCLVLIGWFAGPGNNENHQDLPVVAPMPTRVYNHVEFAAANDLEWPCEAAYSAYVNKYLQTGNLVLLLENHPGYGLLAGDIGVARSVDAQSCSALFHPGEAGETEALLPLHAIQVVEKQEVEGAGPSTRPTLDHRSIILAVAHVYYYRLSEDSARRNFLETLSDTARTATARNIVPPVRSEDGSLAPAHPDLELFSSFSSPAAHAAAIRSEQQLYCDNMVIEAGIARNQALRENIFVVIVSLCNRIPVFVVGRPGTSKSLTIRLISDNLRGDQSPSPFWKRFPSVHVVPYQCSPHSTSDSILFQFNKAVSYASSRGQDSMTVLLLDEVGLAELSPDLPLKVLHEMLVKPPIAIVGISNWCLDSAKMNRACLLQRPDPAEDELLQTAMSIAGSAEASAWLRSLSVAFYDIYTNQQGRPWIGMRDFYSLVKALRRAQQQNVSFADREQLDWTTFVLHLCRNFGGKSNVLERVLRVFQHQFTAHGNTIGSGGEPALPSSLELIRTNLSDESARHLMVLTVHGAALALLFQCGIVSHETSIVLIGSSFTADSTEYHLISQINSIKHAMRVGKTVVLLNCDSLYEALYDVLNQAFVTRMAGTQVQRFLRLAVGKRSQLCPVHPSFRLIAVTEMEHAYNELDLPLLNRLEKQLLRHSDVCSERGLSEVTANLEAWMSTVLRECGTTSHTVENFCPGFHPSSVASLVLAEEEAFLRPAPLLGELPVRDPSLTLVQGLAGLIEACLSLPHLEAVAQSLRALKDRLSSEEVTRLRSEWVARRHVLKLAAVMTTGKQILARCVTPLAVLKSKTLREACPTIFEDPVSRDVVRAQVHDSLTAFVQSHLAERALTVTSAEMLERGGVPCTYSLLMTRSPSSHLEAALEAADYTQFVESKCIGVTRLQLADFDSVKSFQSQVQAYFEQETIEQSQLIVQCDPFLTQSLFIDHARHICRKEAASAEKRPLLSCSDEFRRLLGGDAVSSVAWCAQAMTLGRVPLFPRHVLFVLHVPLGIAQRTRAYPLTFEDGWERCFIDDLQRDSEGTTTVQLLRASVFEMTQISPEFELGQWIPAHFTTALSMIIQPHLPTEAAQHSACLFPARIACLRRLLQGHIFLKLVVTDVEHVLKDFSAQDSTDGLHAHVRLAMKEAGRVGTLRQSLIRAVFAVLQASLATVISRLDRNFNLRVLESGQIPVDVWYAMASVRGRACFLGDLDLDTTTTIAALNDGQGSGAFSCHFPFSYSLIQLLEERRRNDADDLGSGDLGTQLDGAVAMAVGPRVFECIGKFFAERSAEAISSYLKDFVHQTAPTFSTLPVEHQVLVYSLVLHEAEGIQSLGAIHATVYANEQRLFLVCSILDVLSCHRTDLYETIMARLRSCLDSAAQSQAQPAGVLPPESMLEAITVGFLVDQLGVEAAAGEFGGTELRRSDLEDWCTVVTQLRPSIVTYVTMRNASSGSSSNDTLTPWVRVETFYLVAAEILLPTLCAVDVVEEGARARELATRQAARQRAAEMARHRNRSPYDRGDEWNASSAGNAAFEEPMGPVDSKIRPVARLIDQVLKEIQTNDPFEADTIYHQLTLLAKALQGFFPRKWNGEVRLDLLRRFTNRLLVEVICRQPPETWPASLVTCVASIALGTCGRLPAGVSTSGLQKALLHRVSESEARFASSLAKASRGMSLQSQRLFALFSEDQSQWQQQRTGRIECPICFEPRQLTAMTKSVCGHDLCAECLSDGGVGVDEKCHTCRHPAPLWKGHQYLANAGSMLATPGTSEGDGDAVQFLEHLKTVGLVRCVVRQYAVDVMRTFEAAGSSKPGAIVDFVGTTRTQELQVYFFKTILHEGGSSYLLALLRDDRKLVPWFEPKCALSSRDPPKLPFDPFAARSPTHTQWCVQLIPFVLTGSPNLQELDFMNRANPPIDRLLPVLFGAVFCMIATTPDIPDQAALCDHLALLGLNRFTGFAKGLCSNFSSMPASFRSTRRLLVCDRRAAAPLLLSNLLRVQALTHLACVAHRLPGSWFGSLLSGDLQSQSTSFMPSMPEDVLSMIVRATERGGAEQYADLNARQGGINGSIWYMCRNGHPYSVGDCGMNTVSARCPCGAAIGGKDHLTLQSNTRVDQTSVASRLASGVGKGYMQSCVADIGGDSLQRDVSAVAVRVLRLALHGLLLLRALACVDSSDTGLARELGSFVFERSADLHRVTEFLAEQFQRDWDALGRRLELRDENIALFLSIVFEKTIQTGLMRAWAMPPVFRAEADRAAAESRWEQCCVRPFLSGLASELETTRQTFKQGADAASSPEWYLQQVFGDRLHAQIQSRDMQDTWAFREPLTLKAFRRSVSNVPVALAGSQAAATLRKFLDVEVDLPEIKHLPAILNWHRVVFEGLGSGVTRDEARLMTNADLIARFPAARRWRAREALSGFCRAWDTVMPKIELLMGCQENPYRDPKGQAMQHGVRVGHVEMSKDTPLLFSLPNQAKGEEGLECTCTIAMLDRLSTTHNAMLLEFRKAAEGRADVGAGQTAGSGPTTPSSPVVNYLTSPDVVAQKLVVYDRVTHLFPMIMVHSHDDQGCGRVFDLERVASEIERLFAGKSTIAIHARHVVFNGELQKVGLLAMLANTVPQIDMPADVKSRIADELDTQERCTKVMGFLERCIRFVASLGSGAGRAGVDSNMPLGEFVTTLLHLDPTQWADVSTPTLAEGVQLSTLASAYSFLEDCLGNGNPLDRVLPCYQEDLPDTTMKDIQLALPNLQLPVLLPIFRHFLERLRDGATSDPTHLLRDWLVHEPVDPNTDLADLAWFDRHFPVSPQLAHAVATFRALSRD